MSLLHLHSAYSISVEHTKYTNCVGGTIHYIGNYNQSVAEKECVSLQNAVFTAANSHINHYSKNIMHPWVPELALLFVNFLLTSQNPQHKFIYDPIALLGKQTGAHTLLSHSWVLWGQGSGNSPAIKQIKQQELHKRAGLMNRKSLALFSRSHRKRKRLIC